jgi:c-di-GMP-related signal transduction protein
MEDQCRLDENRVAAPVHFMARQSIFDRRCEVFAYALLFRGGPEDYFQQSESASGRVMDNVLLFGFSSLTGNKQAFIKIDERTLRQDLARLLPRSKVVLEIMDAVPANEETLRLCTELKNQGYALALDNFTRTQEREAFLEIADYVKIDFRTTEASERDAVVQRLAGRNIGVIAEKIETKEEFAFARGAGYSLFQGHFLTKPELLKRRGVPRSQLQYARLLGLAASPDLKFDKLEETIKQDPSLCYKLLRYLNSAAFHFHGRVASIRQALVLLGGEEVRRWISVAAACAMGEDGPSELTRIALVRAYFSEELCKRIGAGIRANDGFLRGLLSVMDVILGVPAEEMMAELQMSETVKKWLIEQPYLTPELYDALAASEQGNWLPLTRQAADLQLDEEMVSEVYLWALQRADEIMSAT